MVRERVLIIGPKQDRLRSLARTCRDLPIQFELAASSTASAARESAGRFSGCAVLFDCSLSRSKVPYWLNALAASSAQFPVLMIAPEAYRPLFERQRGGNLEFLPTWQGDSVHCLACRLMGSVSSFRARAADRRRAERRMARMVKRTHTDPLTGLANRRAFEELLRGRRGRWDRRGGRASLLMIDVDHFKRINDTLGHAAGDQVLRQIAGLLEAESTMPRIAFRWGGEEFLVLLPDTPLPEAASWAERLRKRTSNLRLPASGGDLGVSLSIGVINLPKSRMTRRAVDLADAAMYRAKSLGRDQVYVGEGIHSAQALEAIEPDEGWAAACCAKLRCRAAPKATAVKSTSVES